MIKTFKCQVCGGPIDGWSDICDICGWEDYFGAEHFPDTILSSNGKSLNQARAEWQEKLKIEKLKKRKILSKVMDDRPKTLEYMLAFSELLSQSLERQIEEEKRLKAQNGIIEEKTEENEKMSKRERKKKRNKNKQKKGENGYVK